MKCNDVLSFYMSAYHKIRLNYSEIQSDNPILIMIKEGHEFMFLSFSLSLAKVVSIRAMETSKKKSQIGISPPYRVDSLSLSPHKPEGHLLRLN